MEERSIYIIIDNSFHILLIVFEETLSNESEGKSTTLRLGISKNGNMDHTHTNKSNISNKL